MVEDELIKILKPIVETKRYLGELQDDSFSNNSLPVVFVDFVQETPIGAGVKTTVNFSLYILHITYSANADARKETNDSLFDLIEKINKAILYKQLNSSCEPLKIDKLSKIADKKSANGYITIYKQDVSIVVQRH